MSKAFQTAKPIRPHAPLSDWRIDKWLRVSRFLGRSELAQWSVGPEQIERARRAVAPLARANVGDHGMGVRLIGARLERNGARLFMPRALVVPASWTGPGLCAWHPPKRP
jgi:hypothetical protein